MERKTQVQAEDGRHDVLITGEFELPVSKLYLAYTVPELIEQWMGNKVLKLDHRDHGSYQFENRDGKGNVVFRANGAIHKVVAEQLIIRTFEMENTPFPVQLEFLQFKDLGPGRSSLSMQIIYKSREDREHMMRLPFAFGVNQAHNKLEEIMSI